MRTFSIRDFIGILLLTLAGILVSGYHYAVEDQAIWLAGVKKELNPAIFPYDSEFFLAQTSLSQFPNLIASVTRRTGLSLEWVVFVIHVVAVFLLLCGCLQLSRRCFRETYAQWMGVSLIAVLLTLPVAGTALLIFGQYLHPRSMSTVALVFALNATLEKRLSALCWLAVAMILHPTLGFFGAMHLAVLAWPTDWLGRVFPRWRPATANAKMPILIPLLLVGTWNAAPPARDFLYLRRQFLQHWTWYELLGALAPPLILIGFARLARKQNAMQFARLSQRLAVSSTLGVAGAALIGSVFPFAVLLNAEVLRTLHLVYVVMFLLGGGLLAHWVLQGRTLRWLAFFLPLAFGMFWSQRAQFSTSPHLEWPGSKAESAWLGAFDWIRQNTPQHAYFALDPRYMESPGLDFHGFRVLAERSMMADGIKDRAVAGISPSLAHVWRAQTQARQAWRQFTVQDFQRLKFNYGVDWVVLAQQKPPQLTCPFHEEGVWVCRLR